MQIMIDIAFNKNIFYLFVLQLVVLHLARSVSKNKEPMILQVKPHIRGEINQQTQFLLQMP